MIMKKLKLLLTGIAVAMGISSGYSTVNWSSTSGGFTIMLDPGHGGSDPGALGPSAPHEGELCLRCANSIVQRFNELGCNYRLTRTGDYDVSLSSRSQMKIAYDPWIFCSIHLNSAGINTAHGSEVFYHHTSGNSSALANYVYKSLLNELGTYGRRCVTDNSFYGYSLAVLNDSYSSIPSILTEAMFVNNPNEWSRIKDENSDGYRSWVNAFVYGFYDYFYNVHGASYGGNTIHNPRVAQKAINVSNVTMKCGYGDRPYQDVNVSTTGLSDGISVWCDDASKIELSTTWLPASGGSVRVTYTDTKHYTTQESWIHFKSGDIQKDVKVTCEIDGGVLGSMNEGFNVSSARGSDTSKGYDAKNIRNFAYMDGKIYCVYETSRIIVLHSQTGELLGELKLGNVVNGGTLKLCDVQVSNGRIFACNLATGSDNLKIYCWDNDTSEPYVVLDTNDKQGCSRLGDGMSIVGTYPSDCWYGFAWDNGSTETRIVEYHQTDNTWTSKYTLACNGSGNYLKVGSNARVYIWGGGNYWIDGNATNPCYLAGAGNGKANCAAVNHQDGHTQGASHHEFYFRNCKYAAHLVFRGSANYTGAKMRVFRDQAGNFTNNDCLQELPTDGLGDTPNTNGTGEVLVNTDGDNFVEAWVLSSNQGIAYYKYGDTPAQNPGKVNQPTLWFSERDSKVNAYAGSSEVKTLYIDGKDLKDGISISLSGPGASNFSIDPTWLSGPGEVKVTYHPTDWSYDWIWLGANSTGAETAWTDVHGSSRKSPTVDVTGDGNFNSYVNESATNTYSVRADNLSGALWAGLWGDNTDQFTLNQTMTLQSPTTVYWDNNRAGWDKVYVWIWDMSDASKNFTGGNWPGVELTNPDNGIYSYTFSPEDTGHQYGIVFANDANHTKTEDAIVINGAVYSAAGRVADRWPHAIPPVIYYDGTFNVTFHPTWVGDIYSNFFVQTDGKPQNFDMTLHGRSSYRPQEFSINVGSIDFGNRPCDVKNYYAVQFEHSNLREPIKLEITGQHANKFSLDCSQVPDHGQVNVIYEPLEMGVHNASLRAYVPSGEKELVVPIAAYSDWASGVNDIATDSNMHVILIDRTLSIQGAQASHVRLYSVTGQLVMHEQDTNLVNLQSLSAGAYIVAVTNANSGMTRRLKIQVK